MAAQTIRQREANAIPGVSRKTIERIGEFISVVGEVLMINIRAPFVAYAQGKRPESFSPREKAVIDPYRRASFQL